MLIHYSWKLILAILLIDLCGVIAKPSATKYQLHDSSSNHYSDSLLRLAEQATSNETKFKKYLDLSLYWSELDTARAYHYLEEARLSLDGGANEFHEGVLLQYSANIIFAHDPNRAKSDYRHADSILTRFQTVQAYQYRSKLWNNYALLLQIADSSVRYMDIIIEKVIPLAKAAGDSLAVGYALTNIGLSMMNANDYEKADQYYQQALLILHNLQDSEEGRLTANVLAARNSIFLKNLDNARVYLDQAALIFTRIPHSLYGSQYYRTEGAYYRHVKNRQRALEMFEKALSFASRGNNEQVIRDIHFEEYSLYRDYGDYETAKQKLILVGQRGRWASLQDRILHIRELARTEYQLGNFRQASDLFENYLQLTDSLYGRGYQLKLAELEQQYHSLEKENKILELNAVNQQHQLSLDRTKRWLLLTLLALGITVFTTFFWRKLARSNKRLLQQKEQLHKKEVEVFNAREKLGHFQIVVQTQEEERNRVARDLHDGLGGLLAGLKLKLSTLAMKQQTSSSREDQMIDHSIADLDRASDELRRIARNLMPESLLSMGLSAALADLCRYLDKGETKISYQSLGIADHYPREMSTSIFRIVTELLNNGLKHANAACIIVQCEENDQCFSLTIEDDGIGFDPEKRSTGLGLVSVRNRVAVLGGRMEIDSEIGHGTTVTIETPILGIKRDEFEKETERNETTC